MNELKIYIEVNPAYYHVSLYVWDNENYYTVTAGVVTANKKTDIGERIEPFLKGPEFFIRAMANALKPSDEKPGRVEQLTNEVEFLRGLIDKKWQL